MSLRDEAIATESNEINKPLKDDKDSLSALAMEGTDVDKRI